MSDLVPRLRRHRALLAIGYDVLAWLAAYHLFAWLRFDTVAEDVPWLEITAVGLGTATFYVAVAAFLRLHQGRAKTASLEEMLLLGVVMMGSGFFAFALNGYAHWIPRTVPAGATLGALVLAAWGRAVWRRLGERDSEGLKHEHASRVLVVGAGEAGRELIGSMLRDPLRQWRPVGFLDDDRYKRHRRIRNVPVLGPISRLADEVRATGVDTVIIAIPSASSDDDQPDPAGGHRGRGRGQGAAVNLTPDPQRQGRPPRPARHRHHRPPRPRPGRHRRRRDRRLPHRHAGAGHRRGRLDRLGAVPPARHASTRPSC